MSAVIVGVSSSPVIVIVTVVVVTPSAFVTVNVSVNVSVSDSASIAGVFVMLYDHTPSASISRLPPSEPTRPISARNLSSPASPPVGTSNVPVSVRVGLLSSVTAPVSAVIVGVSSSPVIVIVTVAESLPPLPSPTV